jgi:hypothetical protein
LGDLRHYLASRWPFPVKESDFHITYGGRPLLGDDVTLMDHNIQYGTTLDVTLVDALAGGGKRPSSNPPDGATKSRGARLAFLKHAATELMKGEVSDPVALQFMKAAKALVDDGPASAEALCSHLTLADIRAIRDFEKDCSDKNGPQFFDKLLGYFVPEAKGLRKFVEDLPSDEFGMPV